MSLSKGNKKVRESNMELLRIISMIMVLGLHINFAAINKPTQVDVLANATNAFARFFFEALCIGAVNTFVLLSGWFGIHASIKGFLKLAFQCLFIGFIILIGYSLFTKSTHFFNLDTVLLRTENIWFIYAYIGLFLLSPILNCYIERTSQKQLFLLILGFYLLQTSTGWYRGFVSWYSNGYSTLSFIGLYLLARYIRMYPNPFIRLSRNLLLFISFACTISISVVAQFSSLLGREDYASLMYSYMNPLIILSSLCIVVAISKINLNSSIINWIASSSLAVYIVHSHPCLFTDYKNIASQIYQTYSGVSYFSFIIAYIISVFLWQLWWIRFVFLLGML